MGNQTGNRSRKSMGKRHKGRHKTLFSYLKIGALIFLLTGFIITFNFLSGRKTSDFVKFYGSRSQADMPFDGLAKIVAMEFGITVEEVERIYMKCGTYGAMIGKPYEHLQPGD